MMGSKVSRGLNNASVNIDTVKVIRKYYRSSKFKHSIMWFLNILAGYFKISCIFFSIKDFVGLQACGVSYYFKCPPPDLFKTVLRPIFVIF